MATKIATTLDPEIFNSLKRLGMPAQCQRVILDFQTGKAVRVYFQAIASPEQILDLLYAIPDPEASPKDEPVCLTAGEIHSGIKKMSGVRE